MLFLLWLLLPLLLLLCTLYCDRVASFYKRFDVRRDNDDTQLTVLALLKLPFQNVKLLSHKTLTTWLRLPVFFSAENILSYSSRLKSVSSAYFNFFIFRCFLVAPLNIQRNLFEIRTFFCCFVQVIVFLGK